MIRIAWMSLGGRDRFYYGVGVAGTTLDGLEMVMLGFLCFAIVRLWKCGVRRCW